MFRSFLAVLLLGAGVCIAGVVLSLAYGTLTGSSVPPIVESIAPSDAALRSFIAAGQQVEMPIILFKSAAYGVVGFYLVVCAGIASALLRAGSRLLAPDADLILAQLRKISGGK